MNVSKLVIAVFSSALAFSAFAVDSNVKLDKEKKLSHHYGTTVHGKNMTVHHGSSTHAKKMH